MLTRPIPRRRFLQISAAALALSSPAHATPIYRWQGIALGARATIRLTHPDAKAITDRAATEISRLEDIFSLYRAGSALAQLKNDAYVTEWSAAARSALRDEPSFWPNSADLTTIVGEEVQSALLGLKAPSAAIESMAKRLQAKMAELPKT